MYHDEFARKPARPRPAGEVHVPSLPLEIGGGLSLGLAASMNGPLSALLYYLGGLLPLVACSLTIAAHRTWEFLADLAPSREIPRPAAMPVPHLGMATASRARARIGQGRTRVAR